MTAARRGGRCGVFYTWYAGKGACGVCRHGGGVRLEVEESSGGSGGGCGGFLFRGVGGGCSRSGGGLLLRAAGGGGTHKVGGDVEAVGHGGGGDVAERAGGDLYGCVHIFSFCLALVNSK